MSLTRDDFWDREEPAPAPEPAPKRAKRAPSEDPVRSDEEQWPAPEEDAPRVRVETNPDAEGKVPPHDLDAEAAVLSAIMLDPAAMAEVADFLEPGHFFSEAHQRIFEASAWMFKNSEPIDVVLVGTRLKNTSRLAQVGGMPYLSQILNAAPAVVNVRKYAATVFDHWRARKLIETARHVMVSGYLGIADVQAYADRATIAMGDIARRSVGARGKTNAEVLAEILRRIDRKPDDDGKVATGIPYGFGSLDSVTGGMHSRELIMVLAPTGGGKTSFEINVALHVAMAHGIGVQVFSTETTKEEWLDAALCCVAQVDNEVFRSRSPTEAECDRLISAAARIAELRHLHIDETKEPTLQYITSVVAARRNAASQKVDGAPLGLVIVDHLHAMWHSGEDRKLRAELEANARGLKNLARDIGLPVLLPAQSVKIEADRKTRLKPKPTSGMTAFCKAAETHADKVFVLQHPPLYVGGRMKGDDKDRLELTPTKGRRMRTDSIMLGFRRAQSRLIDLDAETNTTRNPMLPASREMVDTRPEPKPATPMTPAAAAASEENEERLDWWES